MCPRSYARWDRIRSLLPGVVARHCKLLITDQDKVQKQRYRYNMCGIQKKSNQLYNAEQRESRVQGRAGCKGEQGAREVPVEGLLAEARGWKKWVDH